MNPGARNVDMKKFIATLLLLTFAFGLHAADTGEWLTDFTAAKKKAKDENKPILALFTGSDWCPWCIKWEKEAFSKPEFKNYAKTNLVLLFVDFPDKKPLPKAQAKANDALQQKYKIDGYPTAVMLNADGKKLSSFGYEEGGVKSLLARIESARAGKVAK
jgi:thioredoxin-related protein